MWSKGINSCKDSSLRNLSKILNRLSVDLERISINFSSSEIAFLHADLNSEWESRFCKRLKQFNRYWRQNFCLAEEDEHDVWEEGNLSWSSLCFCFQFLHWCYILILFFFKNFIQKRSINSLEKHLNRFHDTIRIESHELNHR